MANPSEADQHSGDICGFSGSGNLLIKPDGWSKRVIVMVEDSDQDDIGKTVSFSITEEHPDHYQATLSTKPDYSSPANIPIHHDGKHGESVGDTRREAAATKSIKDREFNPKTRGAPELSSDKPDRKFL